MGNLYITVEEFMKQVGNSHLDIEPSVYGGAAIGRLNYCDVYMVIKLDIADGVTQQEIKDMLLYTDY